MTVDGVNKHFIVFSDIATKMNILRNANCPILSSLLQNYKIIPNHTNNPAIIFLNKRHDSQRHIKVLDTKVAPLCRCKKYTLSNRKPHWRKLTPLHCHYVKIMTGLVLRGAQKVPDPSAP